MSDHSRKIAQDARFRFGKNWSEFLKVLDYDRIAAAEQSLKEMLELENLERKSFLDIGSGSGLFSLAARRLGARVHSFDYDPQSVACTKELKLKYFPDDRYWVVEEGSVLDVQYLDNLGSFDFVYSWGVLHHTGAMWQAMENVSTLAKRGGRLFLSIYNDQRWISSYWKFIKSIYHRNFAWRLLVICLHMPYLYCFRRMYRRLTKGTKLDRGMSLWHDMLDWLGGWPFEVAKPEEVFEFFLKKGFVLVKLKTCGGRHGCNEFVFHLPSSVYYIYKNGKKH
jgi:2-polyprenyl-3-methyl-5-hydroxy-6-metoxy-1,4-benzoquinol methylase